MYQLILLRDA